MISSRLSNASGFSIFATIGMSLQTGFSRAMMFLILMMSSGLRTKERAIASTFCSNPNFRSSISFSDKLGRSIFLPGRLIPLLDFKTPPMITLV